MMKKHSTRRHPWALKVDAEYAVEQLEKLAKDRKTGECYDPEAKFAELMQEPWFKAQMKRMAKK
jgi:hypothetical protein